MDKLKKHKSYRNISMSDMSSLNGLAINAKTDKTKHVLFKVRYGDIQDIFDDFMKHHNNVLTTVLNDPDADVEVENVHRESFLADYYAVKTVYTELFESSSVNISPGTSLNSTMLIPTSNNLNARLPKIELVKFDGDYKNFVSFRDQFDALVHNNASLTSIEKFTYLLGSIQGSALSLVKTLPLSCDNYLIAYNTLIERFSNRRLQAQSIWSELENAQKIVYASAESYRKLLDIFTENIAALKILKFPTEEWDFILVMMLMKRLDNNTLTRFEMDHRSTEIPTFKKLVDFISSHCMVLETLNSSEPSRENNQKFTNRSVRKPPCGVKNTAASARTTSLFTNKSPSVSCIFCKETHSLYTCSAFAAKSLSEKYDFCKNSKLCFNCLSTSHDLRSCKSTRGCRVCNSKRHHTLLHDVNRTISSVSSPANPPTPQPAIQFPSSSESPCSFQSPGSSSANTTFVGSGVVSRYNNVLLSTALIDVLDNRGNFQRLRCLLDSGSMTCFIRQKVVLRLGLRKIAHSLDVQGLGSMTSRLDGGLVNITLKPTNADSPIFFTDAIIVKKICEKLPAHRVIQDDWSHIKNLPLADPEFYNPQSIDLLLGADIFSRIILSGTVTGNHDQPVALKTVFGYILMGRTGAPRLPSISSFFIQPCDQSLENILQKFWETEDVPLFETLKSEESDCEQYFLETVSRAADGKYIVSLPFRENSTPLFFGMREFALSRFYSLERRLLKQPHLYSQYKDFMLEYLNLGHMEVVPSPEIAANSYYLVHHCVLKHESPSTKLRVVFNGSAQHANQNSLNEQLMIGPKLQQDICKLLITFRIHPFVICCDVKKMYRMIWLERSQWDFQRIIFRFSSDEPIQDYRLKTVTYGLRPSPYLALRVLRKLAEDEGSKYPLASNAILHNSYIDDFILHAASIDHVRTIRDELISLMEKAGFQLRKFCSNEPSLLNDLPEAYLSVQPLTFDTEPHLSPLKVLGLRWNPTCDYFYFFVEPLKNRSCSKRVMLSELARVYDPLGMVAPITFLTKHLIQKLWILKCDWDELPTYDIVRVWQQYKSELPLLSELKIPRLVIPALTSSYELHGFCDSSELGYACVIYLRAKQELTISTHFLCAKSKVAPLKKLTIPRLELCAAVLLTKVMSFVLNCLENSVLFDTIVCWSDSQIVLHWLAGAPHRWKTFVANRVSFIQNKLPRNSWCYIDSKNNPADMASRGLFPSALITCSMWFEGPPILKEPEIAKVIPSSMFAYPQEEERQLIFFANLPMSNFLENILNQFSSFFTIIRVAAYVLRFIFNIRNRANNRKGPLLPSELHVALLTLVKYTQQVYFVQELENKKFSRPLRKLHAFMDTEGILRVGGRLQHAQLPQDAKHPILLPRQSRLTYVIIEHYHKKYLHAGFRTTQYLITQKFWILSSKRAINSVVSKCIRCWKTNPKNYQPPMAALPMPRISQAKPFLNSAVDFGGPYLITLTRHRGVKSCKAYICVFVCLATKAVHLELASDLSSETFLAALQRFVARRGRVSKLFCDNATNFVGASKQVKLMQTSAAHEMINFAFSPPTGPHFNGLAEAGIKSVKTHLIRVVGDQILSFEEFTTILTLIEATLNSRPLTSLSSDIESVDALTPGHFLTLEPLSAIPTPDFSTIPMNRLSRWQLLQRLHSDFWRRWRLEYLHTLQQRLKWLDSSTPPQIGTLVLIKDDNLPPGKWTLARIIKLHPGDDKICRVVTVRTPTGTLKRPLVKLCPLPNEHIISK